MEVKAKAKFIKISPRKVRLVADVVRGMTTADALDRLNHINKRAVEPISKLIESAVANADNNYELDKKNLMIKEIRVDEGPTLHRWMPRARGRATPVRKRTSHISIVLNEIVPSGKKGAKKAKLEAPIKLDKKPKEDEGVAIKSKSDKNKAEKSPEEKGKRIVDPRSEGRGKHTKIEGSGEKGFVNKIFRRKSG